MTKKNQPNVKQLISKNKKASFNYFIEEEFEAGIALTGSEVKSAKEGKANIEEAYGLPEDGEVFLHNLHIAKYEKANMFNHMPRRPRKLLMHKKEIRKLIGKVKIKGYTLVAMSLYINYKNLIKVKIALAKGKKVYDKRQALKEKDWKRQKERMIKNLT
jgi:SsrA-binding protein